MALAAHSVSAQVCTEIQPGRRGPKAHTVSHIQGTGWPWGSKVALAVKQRHGDMWNGESPSSHQLGGLSLETNGFYH